MQYFVDLRAVSSGDESKERPFQRINEAAGIAKPGDEVIVAPGVYREYVEPKNAGTQEARIVYRSEQPLGAVITGAEECKNWTRHEGNVWTTRVRNSIFGSYNPYTTYVRGDWYFEATVRHTGSVFLNDRMMYETVTYEECLSGEKDPFSWVPEESVYKWYTEQDGEETVLYANFQDKDPNRENVEITEDNHAVREWNRLHHSAGVCDRKRRDDMGAARRLSGRADRTALEPRMDH